MLSPANHLGNMLHEQFLLGATTVNRLETWYTYCTPIILDFFHKGPLDCSIFQLKFRNVLRFCRVVLLTLCPSLRHNGGSCDFKGFTSLAQAISQGNIALGCVVYVYWYAGYKCMIISVLCSCCPAKEN